MFVTHPPFQHRLQLDDKSTMWTSIEIALHRSWYLATVFAAEDPVNRTFALGTNDDLLLFAERPPLGALVGLQLMLAPKAATSAWRTIRIVAVGRLVDKDHPMPMAIVTAEDGAHYGGVPVKRLSLQRDQLTPLVEIPVPRSEARAILRRRDPSCMIAAAPPPD